MLLSLCKSLYMPDADAVSDVCALQSSSCIIYMKFQHSESVSDAFWQQFLD